MLTVKQVKEGAVLPNEVYISTPYLVIGKRYGIVLHAGNMKSIIELPSYYDDCEVKIRTHDIYLANNTKIDDALVNWFYNI